MTKRLAIEYNRQTQTIGNPYPQHFPGRPSRFRLRKPRDFVTYKKTEINAKNNGHTRLKRSVAWLSLRGPGFNPWRAHMGSMVVT